MISTFIALLGRGISFTCMGTFIRVVCYWIMDNDNDYKNVNEYNALLDSPFAVVFELSNQKASVLP